MPSQQPLLTLSAKCHAMNLWPSLGRIWVSSWARLLFCASNIVACESRGRLLLGPHPETNCTITIRQLGPVPIAWFKLQENLSPALRQSPHTDFNRQQMFFPAFIKTNDNQGTELHLLTPQSAIDAVCQHIDPTVFIQSLVTPTPVLLPQYLL